MFWTTIDMIAIRELPDFNKSRHFLRVFKLAEI